MCVCVCINEKQESSEQKCAPLITTGGGKGSRTAHNPQIIAIPELRPLHYL